MNPLLDERARTVGEDVRDYAKLHVDLARTEVRDGSTRFVWGLVVFAWGFGAATLAIMSACAALYLFLHTRMPPAAAAAVMTIVFVGASALAYRLGCMLVANVRSLLLPRTRAMLWEVLSWRNGKSDS